VAFRFGNEAEQGLSNSESCFVLSDVYAPAAECCSQNFENPYADLFECINRDSFEVILVLIPHEFVILVSVAVGM
jgi:hypothetical protein